MSQRPSLRAQRFLPLTTTDSASAEPDHTLAERLAPTRIADIEAISDNDVAELMGATAEDFASEPARTWRGEGRHGRVRRPAGRADRIRTGGRSAGRADRIRTGEGDG